MWQLSEKDGKYDSGYFDAKEDWVELTKPKLLYTIEESRLSLQTIWDAHGHLVQKTAFILVIVIGLIGYIFNKWLLQSKPFESLLWYEGTAVLVYILLLIYVFFRLIKYQCPLWSPPIGTQPKNIFKPPVMNWTLEDILVKQLESYQDRIHFVSHQNVTLAKAIQHSYWILLIYPLVVITVHFLFWVYSILQASAGLCILLQ